MHQLSLVLVALHRLLNQLVDVVRFVDVYQAELLEIDVIGVVEIYQVIHFFVVGKRHRDTAELKALHELLELHLAIKIEVEVPERNSVVFEFLLESLMDLSQELLDLAVFFEQFVLKVV